jgi:alanine racemase
VLRLSVDERVWRRHVDAVRAAVPRLVPVVKGNGYGFGRSRLAALAAGWHADEVAVGTVHELADALAAVPEGTTVVSLTPAMHLPDGVPDNAVLTVGSLDHVAVLERAARTRPVAVKLESSMHRHGVDATDLPALLDRLAHGGLAVHQFVLHLPLPAGTGSDERAVAEVERWLPQLDPTVPLSLGHVSPDGYRALCAAHRTRTFRLRSGTALWHGDKSSLALSADVLEVRSVEAGAPIGYRQVPASVSGHLVMIGAGSAHGVLALDGGLSPFHHARRRMPLVEAPHMHTSMAIVPTGSPVPAIGEWVDVQRPLTSISPDLVEWR